jgi:hypothetical protein
VPKREPPTRSDALIEHLSRLDGSHVRLARKAPGGVLKPFYVERVAGWENEVEARIRRYRDKYNVYVCPHLMNEPSGLKRATATPCCLWADLDEAHPDDCPIKPTIAMESSPGRYAGLWWTDEPVTEELNRRMTYACNADKGGWHFGKLLRIAPGTFNFKYADQPRVRCMWNTGHVYSVRELDAALPAVSAPPTRRRASVAALRGAGDVLSTEPAAGDPHAILRRLGLGGKWRMRLRRVAADRSAECHTLVRDVFEAGGTADDAAVVLLACESFKSKWGDSLADLEREVMKGMAAATA